MKYWMCIYSDGCQGICYGDLVESEEYPDSDLGSVEWEEITEKEYKNLINE